jgi:hypothetical protein
MPSGMVSVRRSLNEPAYVFVHNNRRGKKLLRNNRPGAGIALRVNRERRPKTCRTPQKHMHYSEQLK